MMMLSALVLASVCGPDQSVVADLQLASAAVGSAPAAPASVPYFYQYANRYSPSRTCQNTSVAMLLKHYGVSITPDAITARFGKDLAQSPEGLARVFNHYASQAGIDERLEPTRAGSLEAFRRLAQGDDPVIVHGFMTSYGHVVVTTGYDGRAYTVNDPAGTWSQRFKGGYPRAAGESSSSGQGVRYGKAAFERAISTYSGSGFAPLWYHRVVR